MSERIACFVCAHSNPDRQKDGKIRCTRFSEWRDPYVPVSCVAFIDKQTMKLEEVRRAKGL